MQVAVVLVLALAGCNQIYGLDPTKLETGIVEGCPAPGTTPRYGAALTSLLSRPCFNFTLDEHGRAAAVCVVDDRLVIEEGDDTGLSPATITRTAGENFEDPALTPEGDHLLVRQFGASANVWSLYERTGGSWTFQRDLVNAAGIFTTSVGVPSRGPDHHVLHADTTGVRELSEAMGWSAVRTMTWASLGVTIGYQLNMTPDGLRVVFLADRRMMYAERASMTEPFGVARAMSTIPEDVASTVFMEANCSRVYFSGFSSIFYMTQI